MKAQATQPIASALSRNPIGDLRSRVDTVIFAPLLHTKIDEFLLPIENESGDVFAFVSELMVTARAHMQSAN